LINWHALTGCDTTGHIQGKGKKGCFATFPMASIDILLALAGLGEGDEPFKDVLRGCEEFLCSLFCEGGVRCSDGLYSSSSMMTKELTNCRGLHGT